MQPKRSAPHIKTWSNVLLIIQVLEKTYVYATYACVFVYVLKWCKDHGVLAVQYFCLPGYIRLREIRSVPLKIKLQTKVEREVGVGGLGAKTYKWEKIELRREKSGE